MSRLCEITTRRVGVTIATDGPGRRLPVQLFEAADPFEDFFPVDRDGARSLDADPYFVMLDTYYGEHDLIVDDDLLANFSSQD
jgi:hypothetical protein